MKVIGMTLLRSISTFPGGRNEGGGQFFVEGEEMFNALPVVFKRLGAVAAVHRPI